MKNKRLLIIIIVFAILFLFIPTKLRTNIRNYSWQILKPAGLFFQATFGSVSPYLKSVFHFNQIIKENSSLVSENLELQSKVAELSETKNENEVLKKELGFMQTQDLSTMITSAVIGRSNDYLKSLVIDKGSEVGIKEGDAVISHGVLIGVISQARKNNSDITLITDYNSLVPVILQNSRGTGLLRGGLGGLKVENVPLNIAIVKNENVVTSGLGGQIPAGILIGRVSDVISREGEIFQEASVSSSIDFSSLKVVFVIKK